MFTDIIAFAGTIAADVTAYLGPDALAGIVFTAGLPWLSEFSQISTELVQSLVPGFSTTEDSELALSTRIEFATRLFNQPEKIPTEVLWSWLGSSTLILPSKVEFQLSRTQDTNNLFKAGADGIPVLVVNGAADRFVNGTAVLEVLDGHFEDLTVHTVANGSHVLFYENQDEYVGELSKFAKRVFANRSK